jgi:hypothetical protein
MLIYKMEDEGGFLQNAKKSFGGVWSSLTGSSGQSVMGQQGSYVPQQQPVAGYGFGGSRRRLRRDRRMRGGSNINIPLLAGNYDGTAAPVTAAPVTAAPVTAAAPAAPVAAAPAAPAAAVKAGGSKRRRSKSRSRGNKKSRKSKRSKSKSRQRR